MNELALFAGAGGGILGGRLLGWSTKCAVEIDAYCRSIILSRQKDGILQPFPIWDNIRTFNGKPWKNTIDVVTAGFPCQPWSQAGQQKGKEDERNLWPDTIRVIREVRSRYVFLENVTALLANRYFGRILGDLAESGYNAKWDCFPAYAVRAPHRRDRLYLLAWGIPNANGGGIRIESKRRSDTAQKTDSWNTEPEYLGKELANANSTREYEQENTGDEIRGRTENCSCWPPGPSDMQSWRSMQADSQPCICRVANGIPSRAHRLKAIGNAQIPAVAAYAWTKLIEGVE